MTIDKIPLVPFKPQNVNPVFGTIDKQPKGLQEVNTFTEAVNGFSKKTNPFASQKISVEGTQGNYKNGLSFLKQGALGEEAIYTKNGRAGTDLNFIA